MDALKDKSADSGRYSLVPVTRILLTLLLSVFAILWLASTAFGQTIRLKDFLDLVRTRHPFFEKERLTADIERKKQDSFLGAQDWNLSASPRFDHQSDIFGGLNPESVDQVTAEVAARRTIWDTGGRLGIEWSSGYASLAFPALSPPFNNIPLGPTHFYQNQIALTYSQPLLQNYKGKLDRLGYDLASHSVNIAGVQALENQEDFLLDVGLRFFDWLLLTEQKIVATERLRLAGWQLEQAKKKRKANLVDKVDVLRSEDAVRIAEQNVVLIEVRWKAKQAELAVLARAEELYTQSPAFDLYARATPPGTEDAMARLREHSRLLKALAIKRKQFMREQRGFEETARPRLSLDTRLALKSGGNQAGDSFQFDENDTSVFLLFSYPLGNRTATANVQKATLQIRQLDLEVEQIAVGLEANLRNLLIQIEQMEKVLSINEVQMKTAQAKTREELKRYNQGRSDLTFVIQSQDNEELARLTYAQNTVTYHGLKLRLSALLDDLLPANPTGASKPKGHRP